MQSGRYPAWLCCDAFGFWFALLQSIESREACADADVRTEEHGVITDDGHLAVIRHLSGTLLGHGNMIIPDHGRRVHDDHAIGSPSSSQR